MLYKPSIKRFISHRQQFCDWAMTLLEWCYTCLQCQQILWRTTLSARCQESKVVNLPMTDWQPTATKYWHFVFDITKAGYICKLTQKIRDFFIQLLSVLFFLQCRQWFNISKAIQSEHTLYIYFLIKMLR